MQQQGTEVGEAGIQLAASVGLIVLRYRLFVPVTYTLHFSGKQFGLMNFVTCIVKA